MATMRAIAGWFDARRRVVGYALLGWVILIVVGAGRQPGSGEWFVIPDLSGVLPVAIGLLALVELVLIVYLRPSRRRARPGSRPRLSLLSLVLIAIVVVLVALAIGPQQAADDELVTDPAPVPTSLQVDTAVAGEQSRGGQSTEIAALLVILVIVGALLVRSGSRQAVPASRLDDGFDEPAEVDLGPAIDEATHHLQIGTDPRMAVIAAYAGLERALAGLGHGREPAETPSEHLKRVLSAVPVLAAPAVRLGRLYELARFSNHRITEAHRRSAAAELRRARQTLLVLASDAQ